MARIQIRNGISRRDFASRVGVATAGVALFGRRILGANDRVVLASIGIRGQGNALKRGFAQLTNVAIKTLCDPDGNLAPERIHDERLKDVASFKPGFVQDMRRVFEHVYEACRKNLIPIGVAPNIEVSLICQPDDTRYLAEPGWRRWLYEAYLRTARIAARPMFARALRPVPPSVSVEPAPSEAASPSC